MLLMNVSEAREQIVLNVREWRLKSGLTQRELSSRSGVPLPTIRKFEQQGQISFESFLKIQMVLGNLEELVKSTKSTTKVFRNMDDVLNDRPMQPTKRGRSKHYGG